VRRAIELAERDVAYRRVRSPISSMPYIVRSNAALLPLGEVASRQDAIAVELEG
jgi:hypothetical protein